MLTVHCQPCHCRTCRPQLCQSAGAACSAPRRPISLVCRTAQARAAGRGRGAVRPGQGRCPGPGLLRGSLPGSFPRSRRLQRRRAPAPERRHCPGGGGRPAGVAAPGRWAAPPSLQLHASFLHTEVETACLAQAGLTLVHMPGQQLGLPRAGRHQSCVKVCARAVPLWLRVLTGRGTCRPVRPAEGAGAAWQAAREAAGGD